MAGEGEGAGEGGKEKGKGKGGRAHRYFFFPTSSLLGSGRMDCCGWIWIIVSSFRLGNIMHSKEIVEQSN